MTTGRCESCNADISEYEHGIRLCATCCEPCADGEHATIEDGRCTCCGQLEHPECGFCGAVLGVTSHAGGCDRR